MERIERLMAGVTHLPDSGLTVCYRGGRAEVELGGSRSQTVFITRCGEGYALFSVVMGAKNVKDYREDVAAFAERLWCRNRQTDMVNFTFDDQNRLVGRIDHPTPTLDAAELHFCLSRLAVECDRMEFLLTGENRF